LYRLAGGDLGDGKGGAVSLRSALSQHLELLGTLGAAVAGHLEGPADDADLLAVATAAGPVPADLAEVWSLHNGTRPGAAVGERELGPPFRLLSTAESARWRMDRRDPENLWSEFFAWSTEFDGLGICLPVLEADSLSLLIDVGQSSGELLLFDSFKSEGIVTPTGLDLEAWFELQMTFLQDGWLEVVGGTIGFPAQWPSATMPSVEPRLVGLETWNPKGPGIP
jgi:hypothetical protein